MKYLDTLFLSIKNLWRHKLRTILTITGVMIGTCSIVVMLSLGLAMNRNFLTQLSQMGNIMQIQVYSYNEGGKSPDGSTIEPMDDKRIAEFAKMDGVEGATPIMNLNLKVVVGKYMCYANILGVDPNVFDMLDIPIQDGRGLTPEDTDQMVVGGVVSQMFYNPKSMRYDPAPQDFNLMDEKVTMSWDMSYGEKVYPGMPKPKVKAKPVKVNVVGTVAQSGTQYDYSFIMPIEAVKKYQKEQDKFNKANNGDSGGGGGGGMMVKYAGGGMMSSSGTTMKGYNQAIIKVKDIDSVTAIMEAINNMGYQAQSPIQMLDDMKKQSAGLRQILGGIGIMAFIIAVIGILNTMYMSIYERTREIGIIKVIGARLRDIRRLFMLEAAWIGIFGGVFGVGLSFLASVALNKFNINIGGQIMWMPQGGQQLPSSYIPLWLILAAPTCSFITSFLAGLLPARRAMKLSVMKALRQD